MDIKITGIPDADELNQRIVEAAQSKISELLDEWCKAVESTARRNCNDLEGKRIRFYRDGMTVKEMSPDVETTDCLIRALKQHSDSMDTTLVGVYELVLKKLENRKKMLESRQT
jgi:hypothetical protein